MSYPPYEDPSGNQDYVVGYQQPGPYSSSGVPYAAPDSGAPYAQPQYAQPQYDQPQYDQPQYDQPQYDQQYYDQPQYAQDPYGQQQYPGSAPYGVPPVPVPMAPPPKKGLSGGAVAIIIVSIVLVVCGSVCVISEFAPSSSSSTDSSTSNLDGTADDGETPSAATAPATGSGKAILTLSGSGLKQSKTFTTGPEWQLSYTYDCSSQGSDGVFAVLEHAKDGTTTAALVDEENKKGDSSTSQHNDAGVHYLEVASYCKWTVKVTDG